MDPRLLHYYNRELQHLREMGGEFAKEFPKIAGRLGLEGFECADPYVERMLEGFGFLAARIQLKLDAEYPHDARPPERIRSTLVVEGQPGGGTAMARSVGLPVVIAVKLLLGGELSLTGCLIPTHPAIYAPVLRRIEQAGLRFEESRTQIGES